MTVNNTIAAISTGGTQSAIALIRVSGSEAITIVNSIFEPANKKRKLTEIPGNSVIFGEIVKNGHTIDEVLINVFRNPKSYTGEDLIEIACHGSIYIQQEILSLLLDHGAEPAGPGEFTQRAFLNGKMDLSQAEAVADLIASQSRASHNLAMHQMKGGFAHELNDLRAELTKISALIELELDFAEEDVEFADRSQLINLANKIINHIHKLTSSFKLGNAIKTGIPVVIIGETNVGKSTLLNALLNEDRALVSDIHGTTRDTIEEVFTIEGVNFRLIDTAGIRQTRNTVESMGIERTYEKLRQATIVILVVDATNSIVHIQNTINTILHKTMEGQALILALNKCDLSSEEHYLAIEADQFTIQPISAKNKLNIDNLKQHLLVASMSKNVDDSTLLVTNARHYKALQKAGEAIDRVLVGMESKLSGDFIAQDIRECLHYLGEITGQVSNDEILGYIFKHFCIGK